MNKTPVDHGQPSQELAEAIKETVAEAKAQLDAIELRAESNTAALHIWHCYEDMQDVALSLLDALEAIERGISDASARPTGL